MLQVDTMPRERTFIMIKPDGVQRGLVAKIIARFEEKGFKLVAMKFSQPSKEHLETHYADLKEKKPMEEARENQPQSWAKLGPLAGARRWTSGPGGAGRQTGYSRCQSARRVRAAHADRAFLRDRQGQVPT